MRNRQRNGGLGHPVHVALDLRHERSRGGHVEAELQVVARRRVRRPQLTGNAGGVIRKCAMSTVDGESIMGEKIRSKEGCRHVSHDKCPSKLTAEAAETKRHRRLSRNVQWGAVGLTELDVRRVQRGVGELLESCQAEDRQGRSSVDDHAEPARPGKAGSHLEVRAGLHEADRGRFHCLPPPFPVLGDGEREAVDDGAGEDVRESTTRQFGPLGNWHHARHERAPAPQYKWARHT